MVELLRPAMSGVSLDFSKVNEKNQARFAGRNPTPKNAGSSRGEPAFNPASKSNKVAGQIRGANLARGQQLDRLSGGDIRAGEIGKAPSRATQQATLDASLEEKGNR